MKIKSATLIIDSCQTPDVAKAMFRFWDWQYIETQKETIVARAALVGAKHANEVYENETRDYDDWRGVPPFSDGELRRKQERISELEKELQEATAMRDYVINFLAERAHKCTTKLTLSTIETNAENCSLENGANQNSNT